MDFVKDDVKRLTQKELEEANKRFPLFASPHEAWAILREEMTEVETERYLLDSYVENRLWNEVRKNLEIPKEDLEEVYIMAVNMAVESIQVAAMIKKIELSKSRWTAAADSKHQ